jgi:hypothetical protein
MWDQWNEYNNNLSRFDFSRKLLKAVARVLNYFLSAFNAPKSEMIM